MLACAQKRDATHVGVRLFAHNVLEDAPVDGEGRGVVECGVGVGLAASVGVLGVGDPGEGDVAGGRRWRREGHRAREASGGGAVPVEGHECGPEMGDVRGGCAAGR